MNGEILSTRMRYRLFTGGARLLLVLLCGGVQAQPQPAASAPASAVPLLGQIDVLGRAPLPGLAEERDRYPGNVQTADDAAIERSGGASLPEFMNRQLQGVTVNEVQGSPFQVDVNYRGQRLSPTLGSAQGLSVYLDGVRINEPFGDVMNWDLLPEAAISGLALLPGSNPLFGLNTLGGALVLTTKSGATHPGTEVDVSLASFGRRRLDFSHGREWGEGWHAYAAGTQFRERGWRDESPGELGNLFLKLGRQQGASDWGLSYLQARSELVGNGLLSQSLYNIDRRSGYTFEDRTRQRARLLNFTFNHALDAQQRVSASAWLRKGQRDGSTGDVNGKWTDWLAGCQTTPTAPACADPSDPGYVGHTAVVNRSRADQSSGGVGLQWSGKSGAHQLTAGTGYVGSRIGYDQFEQLAAFDGSRVARPDLAEPVEQQVSLRGDSATASLYGSDVIALGPDTQLTLSARYNRTRVRNTLDSGTGPADESFSYSKLNPAVGATHALGSALTLFGNWSQGTRVPTALELGCADPARPCVLPTGLQADPYLKQVVARTVEVGLRTRPATGTELSAALFRTVSKDDLVFVRSGVSQGGYFSNIDRTLRRGLELSAQSVTGNWRWQGSYTWLQAVYLGEGVLQGPLSTDAEPNRFSGGTPIAGLPQHALKASVTWRATARLNLGADLLAASSQAVAGNESGLRPELGRLAGHKLLHLRSSYQLTPHWQSYLRVNNALKQRYASFAGSNRDLFPAGRALQPGEEAAAARFLAPGAGRSILVGARYVWD
ncbi:MAG: TonB-dependent receptor [Polaromonas sp.]|nr:TonB-dependent receptor [Polaromonas sp.]